MITKQLTEKPIAIASDHRGWERKRQLIEWLLQNGFGVKDCGADSSLERRCPAA